MTILTSIVFATGSEPSNDGGSIFSFLLLPLMLVAMYFFIIRPNSKKRKQQTTLQSALGVGDEVITSAGIIGRITGEDGPTRFWLEIDEDVQVRIARGGIAGLLDPDAPSADEDEDDDDEDDDTDVNDAIGAADDAAAEESDQDS